MPYDSPYWWIIRLTRGVGSMQHSFASIVISSVAGLVLTRLPVGRRVRYGGDQIGGSQAKHRQVPGSASHQWEAILMSTIKDAKVISVATRRIGQRSWG